MIPKIIHYCWLSGEPIPTTFKNYIREWKKILPDYSFKCWDKNAFDVTSIPFVYEAYLNKKWAYAADYIRIYALYTEGGIYLDLDVKLRKTFDPYLSNKFFTSIENHFPKEPEKINGLNRNFERQEENINIQGIGLQAAIIGGEKAHPLFLEILDFYNKNNFNYVFKNKFIAPSVFALFCEKYGFIYKDEEQILRNGIHIFPSTVFSQYNQYTRESVAIHFCAGSWVEKKLWDRIKEPFKGNILLQKVYSKIKNLIK